MTSSAWVYGFIATQQRNISPFGRPTQVVQVLGSYSSLYIVSKERCSGVSHVSKDSCHSSPRTAYSLEPEVPSLVYQLQWYPLVKYHRSKVNKSVRTILADPPSTPNPIHLPRRLLHNILCS